MRTVKFSYDKFALWHTLTFIMIGVLVISALAFGDGSGPYVKTMVLFTGTFIYLIYFFRTYLSPATKGSSPLIITEEKIFIRQSNTTIYWSKVLHIKLLHFSRMSIIKFSLKDDINVYFRPRFF